MIRSNIDIILNIFLLERVLGIGDDYALVAEISLEELLGEDIKNINYI